MGIDVTFYTIIGVLVTKKDLGLISTEVKVNSCEHSDQSRSGKYCTECGLRVRVNTQIKLDPKEDDFFEYIQESKIAIAGPEGDDTFFLGHYEWLSEYGTKTIISTELYNDMKFDILYKINKFLADAPHKIDYRVTPEQITIYSYLRYS